MYCSYQGLEADSLRLWPCTGTKCSSTNNSPRCISLALFPSRDWRNGYFCTLIKTGRIFALISVCKIVALIWLWLIILRVPYSDLYPSNAIFTNCSWQLTLLKHKLAKVLKACWTREDRGCHGAKRHNHMLPSHSCGQFICQNCTQLYHGIQNKS